jgi:hypothetical protein
LNTNFGQRLSSAQLKSKRTTGKQTILLAVKAPNLQPIHTAVAQFKALRAQGKSAQAPSMVQTYRTNVSRQFDGYFAGKSPAGIATQRDQLIAEARTRFAKDPKTENGVIDLITSEAQKRGAAVNAAIPGQPVVAMATTAAKTAPVTAMTPPTAAMTTARPQTGLLPAAAPSTLSTKVPSAIPVTVPATTSAAMPANVVSNPPKAAAWGTTAAWTPPAAASIPAAAASAPAMTTAAPAAPHAVTAIKPAMALKTIQPVARSVEQRATASPAPSTTTSAPQACNKVANKLPCVCVTGSTNNPAGCMAWDLSKNHAY